MILVWTLNETDLKQGWAERGEEKTVPAAQRSRGDGERIPYLKRQSGLWDGYLTLYVFVFTSCMRRTSNLNLRFWKKITEIAVYVWIPTKCRKIHIFLWYSVQLYMCDWNRVDNLAHSVTDRSDGCITYLVLDEWKILF